MPYGDLLWLGITKLVKVYVFYVCLFFKVHQGAKISLNRVKDNVRLDGDDRAGCNFARW